MTADENRDDARDEAGDAKDIDSAFDLIVSSMHGQMNWDTSALPDIDTPAVAEAPPLGEPTAEETERARRRQRRAEELAEYNAQKAEVEADYLAEDGSFVPPDPGPLPKLRSSTIAALLLILVGLVLLIAPTLLSINQSVTIVLAVVLVIGGGIWLTTRLRKDHDPGDNGARV